MPNYITITFLCIQELLFFTVLIGICSSAAIKSIESELESKVQGNAVEEASNETDLAPAEARHFGFGPRVVVINKGYGGYNRGYGGYNRGCGCGGGNNRYHIHRRYGYGKKK